MLCQKISSGSTKLAHLGLLSLLNMILSGVLSGVRDLGLLNLLGMICRKFSSGFTQFSQYDFVRKFQIIIKLRFKDMSNLSLLLFKGQQ